MPKLILVFLLFAIGSTSLAADDRPNFLFIGVDDLRPELQCYGASQMHTPNIDRLAAEGVRFDRAYCQQAVCLPSRISLFTGMRPNSTGVHDLNTRFRETIPDVVTLPQQLGKAGYHTIGMGKVYHDEQPREWNEWIDVKEVSEVSDYHQAETIADIENREAEAKAKGLKGKAFRKYAKGPSVEASDAPDIEYEDAALTQLAIEKIKASGVRPFFMTVGYHKPHLPLVAPKKYWDLYDRKDISLPENYFLPDGAPKLALSTWGELRAYTDIPKEGALPDEKALEIMHGYYACISFVDAQIGLLLNTLESEGMDKNTLVVLWSDHGWKLGEHAMWCKHTNFEIDARVPLMIRLPDAVHGGRSTDAMVELIDLYPTLCDFARTETPENCEGASLAPLLREEAGPQWRQHALSQYKRGRYTEWINVESGETQAAEYYDHTNDPDENRNAHADLTKEKLNSLSELLRRSID